MLLTREMCKSTGLLSGNLYNLMFDSMKHTYSIRTRNLTTNLTILVIVLLFIAIGITVNDNFSQKNLNTQANEIPIVSPTITNQLSNDQATSDATLTTPPQIDQSIILHAEKNNGIETRFLDFLRIILKTVR